MEEDLRPKSVVIDFGSNLTKSGFSGNDLPISVIPTICGTPKNINITYNSILKGMEEKNVYIGDYLFGKRGLSYHYPIEKGIINDFYLFEKFLHHCFYNELRVAPEETNVLITEPPFNPKINREKIIQLMFEKFSVPCFYSFEQEVLSLYSNGRTTGVSINSGEQITRIVPIYEGYSLKHSIFKIDIGGKDVTDNLLKLLSNNGYTFQTSAEKEIVRDIKEKLGFVSSDIKRDLKLSENKFVKSYELPDGNVIEVGHERFKPIEILFNPKLVNLENDGISETVYNSIGNCDFEIRKELFYNICLSGGNTMFGGFSERLKNDVEDFVKTPKKIKVIAPQERKYSAWIGGSLFSSLDIFLDVFLIYFFIFLIFFLFFLFFFKFF
jgi:actin, other eukaryote